VFRKDLQTGETVRIGAVDGAPGDQAMVEIATVTVPKDKKEGTTLTHKDFFFV
jgi:hypothetical protein